MMPTTLQYSARKRGNSPAISHYNFHRVDGAQIAVFSGTRRKPVLTRTKPVESHSAIRKDRFSTRFGKKIGFCLLLARGKPVFWPWKPVKTRPKNMGIW
jgi:hypothetical protein